jgi:FkbM family methyltransferase
MALKITLREIIKAFMPHGLYVYRNNLNKSKREYINKDMLRKIAEFKSYFLSADPEGNTYFDINGAKLPDISDNRGMMELLMYIFEDTFMVPFFFKDNHKKELVAILDVFMREGPYGYTDNEINAVINPQDVVIDAGAWIGDFSAYAASKEGISYAFEPVGSLFKILEKTASLNKGKIIPVQKGLSDKNGTVKISVEEGMNSGANSLVIKRSSKEELISITTLDDFVKTNKIEKIDFIKADIEGEERALLKGASNVLQTFAPKLAICTYHFPEDAKLLEEIIMDTNSKYKIKHLRHKLFAEAVP